MRALISRRKQGDVAVSEQLGPNVMLAAEQVAMRAVGKDDITVNVTEQLKALPGAEPRGEEPLLDFLAVLVIET